MAYFAVCSFDLKNASSKDYENAYADLALIGFHRQLAGETSTVTLTTLAVGEFSGSSTGSLRDTLRTKVKTAFQARGFKAEIFVVVCDGWAWMKTTT